MALTGEDGAFPLETDGIPSILETVPEEIHAAGPGPEGADSGGSSVSGRRSGDRQRPASRQGARREILAAGENGGAWVAPGVPARFGPVCRAWRFIRDSRRGGGPPAGRTGLFL